MYSIYFKGIGFELHLWASHDYNKVQQLWILVRMRREVWRRIHQQYDSIPDCEWAWP